MDNSNLLSRDDLRTLCGELTWEVSELEELIAKLKQKTTEQESQIEALERYIDHLQDKIGDYE